MRTLVTAVGLHARPAAVLVQAVLASGLPITLGRHGFKPVDARSIVSVLSLDIGAGEEVVLGGASDEALAEIAGLDGIFR